jgi:hypothetical protein
VREVLPPEVEPPEAPELMEPELVLPEVPELALPVLPVVPLLPVAPLLPVVPLLPVLPLLPVVPDALPPGVPVVPIGVSCVLRWPAPTAGSVAGWGGVDCASTRLAAEAASAAARNLRLVIDQGSLMGW